MNTNATAPAIFLIDYQAGASDAGIKSKSPLYERKAMGLFVEPIKVGRRSFMTNAERDAMVRAHIGQLPDDDIRKLVASLHAARRVA